MTNQPSVRPLPEFCFPTELIRNWEFMYQQAGNNPDTVLRNVAWEAAQWGADLELEACCEWLDERAVLNGSTALRIARRPKPPSLKEQALEILEINNDVDSQLSAVHYNILRSALEELPND